MVSINWSVALTINSFQALFFFFNFVQKHKTHQWPEFLLELWNNNSSSQTEPQDNQDWKWTLKTIWFNAFLKERPAKIRLLNISSIWFFKWPRWDFTASLGPLSLCSPGKCFSPSHLCGALLISCTLQCLTCKGESSTGHSRADVSSRKEQTSPSAAWSFSICILHSSRWRYTEPSRLSSHPDCSGAVPAFAMTSDPQISGSRSCQLSSIAVF